MEKKEMNRAEKRNLLHTISIIFAGILLLLLAPRFSEAAEPGLPLHVGKVSSAGYLQTALRSDHQGDHEITTCRATLDTDGLHIHFPMSPAYHLEIDMTVKDGRYATDLRWVPLQLAKVENRITSQRLTLEKESYALGATVNGFLELTFTTTWLDDGTTYSFYVKGPFSALVRPAGFDPYADENITTYHDPRVAIYELGTDDMSHFGKLEGDQPLHFSGPRTYTFPAAPTPEEDPVDEYCAAYDALRERARRNFFEKTPQATDAKLREMTWNPTPLSEGNERVTIWFTRAKNGWRQVGFTRWAFDWMPAEDE